MTITDIVSKIYFLTKTNSTSFPTTDMLILINNAYDRIASLIISVDGRWQWDDSNQTDLPIATTALVANQQDYAPAVSFIELLGAEVKDTTGNWIELLPIDQNDIKAPSVTDFLKTPGIPVYYDKLGASIFLYPAPNYSQAASLKLRFQRGPASFTSGDVSTGTKQPGFNTLYHDIIPLWVSYEYLYANGVSTAGAFLQEIMRKEEALKDDYLMRSKDENLNLRVKIKSSR